MKHYILVNEERVFIDGQDVENINTDVLKKQNITFVGRENDEYWVEREPFNGRETDFDKEQTNNIFSIARSRVHDDTPIKKKIEDYRNSRIRNGFFIRDESDFIIGHIYCTETSLTRLDQAALDAQIRPTNWVKFWKTHYGFIEVDKDTIEKLRSEAADLVEACFKREKELLEKLEAGVITEENIYEDWPGISSEQIMELESVFDEMGTEEFTNDPVVNSEVTNQVNEILNEFEEEDNV